jgi:branched-subunit amino acid permease
MSQSIPILSVVYPLSLILILQSSGRVSNQPSYEYFIALKITYEGKAHPVELTASIAVTHSRLPGCNRYGLLYQSLPVITFTVAQSPIAKLVLLKL